jgi:SAM-dependent methyltransferase
MATTTLSEAGMDRLLVDYNLRHYKGVTSPRFDIAALTKHAQLEKGARDQLDQLDALLRIQPQWRILDVGSGFGYFTIQCRRRGLQAFGVEIDREKMEIGAKMFGGEVAWAETFRESEPRRIPFEDGRFDLATMFYVMEHVEDVPAMLAEIRRVLKPGGQVYLACPNFIFPYESHYALPLPTFLPKPVCALWLRLAGRNPYFREHGFSFDPVGLRQWGETLAGAALDTRSKELRAIIRFVNALKLRGLCMALARGGFYTPLVYVLKKS